MNILIVETRPDPTSFSSTIAAAYGNGALAAGHSIDVANLSLEKFNPLFDQAGLDCYHGKGPVPDDVLKEQARVDSAHKLVFVFPICWWSLQAILKGRIDQVFISDWAFKFENGAVVGTMRDVAVVLIGIGGGNDASYTKHRYHDAFNAQITDGIFKFCGIERIETCLLLDAECRQPEKREAHLAKAYILGDSLA